MSPGIRCIGLFGLWRRAESSGFGFEMLVARRRMDMEVLLLARAGCWMRECRTALPSSPAPMRRMLVGSMMLRAIRGFACRYFLGGLMD